MSVVDKNEAIEIIFNAIKDYNDEVEEKNILPLSLDLELFGKDGRLDSLGLVNLIMCIEEKFEEHTGSSIVIADEKAMSQSNSPFRSVNTLAEYMASL